MAVLTRKDGIEMWRTLFKKDNAKALIKENGTLPKSTKLASIFQIFESLWSDNAQKTKTDIEVIIGRPISGAYLKSLGKTWLKWKVGKI